MALDAAWNHILVKIGQLDGPWNFSVRFDSNVEGLAQQLQASQERK